MYLYNLFIKSFEKNKKKVAINIDNKEVSYKDLFKDIENLINTYKILKFNKRRIIAIKINDKLEYIKLLLALNALEIVVIPINSKVNKRKVDKLLYEYKIEYIISYKDNKYKVRSINNSIDEELDTGLVQNSEIGFLTSGTLGTQKIVLLSEKNIRTNLSSVNAYLHLNKDDRVFIIRDLEHASATLTEVIIALAKGLTIYLTHRILTPNVINKIIKTKKITIFFCLGSLLKEIIETNKNNFFESVRIIHFYGERVGDKDILNITSYFKESKIIYSYGLTEASPRVTYITGKELLIKPKSCGKAIENVKICITKAGGKLCEKMQIGEITVSGDNIMLGYLDNKILNSKILRGKKLLTGDLGYIDPEGYLFHTGRKDNMFIYFGKNIFPEEIEEVLEASDGVNKAVIVYNQEERKIEAFISVTKDLNLDMVYTNCYKNLENFKVPKKIYIVEKILQTSNGKKKRLSYLEMRREYDI